MVSIESFLRPLVDLVLNTLRARRVKQTKFLHNLGLIKGYKIVLVTDILVSVPSLRNISGHRSNLEPSIFLLLPLFKHNSDDSLLVKSHTLKLCYLSVDKVVVLDVERAIIYWNQFDKNLGRVSLHYKVGYLDC